MMITLLEEELYERSVDGKETYIMHFIVDDDADYDNLPNEDRPFSPSNYSTQYNYGVPAPGSTVFDARNGGRDALIYGEDGKWESPAGTDERPMLFSGYSQDNYGEESFSYNIFVDDSTEPISPIVFPDQFQSSYVGFGFTFSNRNLSDYTGTCCPVNSEITINVLRQGPDLPVRPGFQGFYDAMVAYLYKSGAVSKTTLRTLLGGESSLHISPDPMISMGGIYPMYHSNELA